MNEHAAHTEFAKRAQLRRMEREHMAAEVVRLTRASATAPTAAMRNMYEQELRNLDDKIKAFDNA
jgi:hypothetical protein